MNYYLPIILALLLLRYGFDLLIEVLDGRRSRKEIPPEFEGWYEPEKYASSQAYRRAGTRFDMISETILTPLTIGFILVGGFAWFDTWARAAGGGVILTGLLFAGMLMVAMQVLQLPFGIWSTFVIEERFGFNRTKPLTFAADQVKGLVLTLLLGGGVFSAILWFFTRFETWAWVMAWVAVVLFQFILLYLAPAYIMPLFNKFIPLEEGELHDAVMAYSERQGFALKGLFTMDGSKRSSKANAFFTGFGRWKRIVLFDTLVEKHSVPELLGVLAHEVGHFKLRHIHKMMAVSVVSSGILFAVLNLFLHDARLYEAFGMPYEPVGGYPPIYAGMVFFGFLYTPLSMAIGLVAHALSRKHEFEADHFAAETTGEPVALADALRKLTVDTLGDLTPHPLKVFLSYSHPPVIQRIRALLAKKN